MQLGSGLAYIAAMVLLTTNDKSFAFDGFFRQLQKRDSGTPAQRKMDEKRLIDGDILGEQDDVKRHSAPGDPDTWIKRRIPFVLDKSIDPSMTNVIHSAMKQIMSQTSTCLRFDVKREFDYDFINITGEDAGCYGSVGRRGGPQILNLGTGCDSVGVVLHELMHALGFWHEQSRSDRDDYVKVLLENVRLGEESNFNKRNKEPVEDNIPYDYDSIMHYRYDQFSKNGGDTLLPTDRGVDKDRLGQRLQLSQLDIQRVMWLYDCKVRYCPSITTFRNGIVSVDSYVVGGRAKHRCNSQFVLIGTDTRTCKSDGAWSGSVPYCAASRAYPFLYYNMNNVVTLTQTTTIQWTRHRGPTPSEDTGPHVDHTDEDSTGWYFYLEATDIPMKTIASFVTSSVRYVYSGGACLTFWYYMYGEGMGTLTVYVTSNYTSRRILVWSSDRNGVIQEKIWQMATDNGVVIQMPVGWYTYQVIFEARRGDKDTSDIAVDDVIVGHCNVIKSYQSAVRDEDQRNSQLQSGDYFSVYRSSSLKKFD